MIVYEYNAVLHYQYIWIQAQTLNEAGEDFSTCQSHTSLLRKLELMFMGNNESSSSSVLHIKLQISPQHQCKQMNSNHGCSHL